MGYFKNQKFPVAEYLSENGFYIPSGLALTKKQQDYVIKEVQDIFNRENKLNIAYIFESMPEDGGNFQTELSNAIRL